MRIHSSITISITINNLPIGGSLPTTFNHSLLEEFRNLPQVGGLSDKQGSVRQVRENMGVVGTKIAKYRLVSRLLKRFTTDFYGNHVRVRQFGYETTTTSHWMVFYNRLVVCTYQTIYPSDKIIFAHGYFLKQSDWVKITKFTVILPGNSAMGISFFTH
jgi:hypothetical protein